MPQTMIGDLAISEEEKEEQGQKATIRVETLVCILNQRCKKRIWSSTEFRRPREPPRRQSALHRWGSGIPEGKSSSYGRRGHCGSVSSPWAAKSRLVREPNGKLRMVHTVVHLNKVTMKSSYPMWWIEPIPASLGREHCRVFLQAGASNVYYAVPLYWCIQDRFSFRD